MTEPSADFETVLPARFKGMVEGSSIDLYRVQDQKEVLVVKATDADGGSVEVPVGMAMANALWSRLREWTYEAATGKAPPTDRP